MGSQETKILLEKYWRGETTAEEEKRLTASFGHEHQGEEEKYSVIFRYRDLLGKEESEGFDLSFLDDTASLPDAPVAAPLYGNWKKWAIGTAAAVLLAVFSVAYQWPRTKTLEAQAVEVERAYTETLAALQLVAENLNKGSASIREIGVFDRTTKQIIHEN